MNRALVNADGRTERLKTLDMQVDRARYEVTAARKRACRHAETTQFRAEDIIRCANRTGKFIRSGAAYNARRIDLDSRSVQHTDACAHGCDDLKRRGDVTNLGDIFNYASVFDKYCGKNYGKRGVFHSADFDFSAQALAAVDDKPFHVSVTLSASTKKRTESVLLRKSAVLSR